MIVAQYKVSKVESQIQHFFFQYRASGNVAKQIYVVRLDDAPETRNAFQSMSSLATKTSQTNVEG